MSLTTEEIVALLEEMRGLDGSRVRRLRGLGPYTVVLELRTVERKKELLLLSTRPRLARFHLVETFGESPKGGGPFTDVARAHLEGRVLRSFRQVSGDRVVELTFAARSGVGLVERGGGGGRADGRTPAEVRLVLEIRGGRGHLILVDDGRKIIATLHPLRRSGKEIGAGDAYRFPPSRPGSSLLKAATPSPWRHLSAREVGGEGEGRPLHRVLAARYAALEAEQEFLERKSSLLVRLRREESRLSDLAMKVRGDLEEARAGEGHKKKGELLKGAYGSLRRGLSEIELEDYFEPAGGTIRIALDPALGPQENIERYFRRYRKCARAVPFLQERLAAIEAELRGTAEARRRVEVCERPEELAELDSIEGRSRSGPAVKAAPSPSSRGSPSGKRRSARRPVPSPSAGPRRFVSSDGFEILVGRNARGNDELVTRIGRGNDTFLHVSGRPGAHVVIRHVPGKTVPLSTLVEAAKLGVYYSLPERSRGAVGAGMTAEVDYAPLKHVRKPKGEKPGLVLLTTRKTLRVRLDVESVDRLLRPPALPESPSSPN